MSSTPPPSPPLRAPSTPPPPSATPDDDDEASLAMTPTRPPAPPSAGATSDVSEDAALLADFDRYISTSDPAPLDRLAARYPHCDRDVLQDVLASVQHDPAAADLLLRDSALPPPSPAHAPTAPTTTHDADAALAERLHRRERGRAAAAEDRTRRHPQHSQHPQQPYRPHRRNNAVVPLNKAVLESMVATLREIVVPALRAHFEELVLPDTADQSAAVHYRLRGFQVSGLSLPPHNIVVKAAPDSKAIRVNVINVFLELEVAEWSYESKGFVPFKDAGTARVSVHGLSVAITLQPRWSHAGGTKVVISDCNVTIDGVVRLKTQGAAADWAYNAVAIVLKPLIVSYVKDAIAATVTNALAVHLSQWAFSNSLDEEATPRFRVIDEEGATGRTRVESSSHRPSAGQAPVTAAE